MSEANVICHPVNALKFRNSEWPAPPDPTVEDLCGLIVKNAAPSKWSTATRSPRLPPTLRLQHRLIWYSAYSDKNHHFFQCSLPTARLTTTNSYSRLILSVTLNLLLCSIPSSRQHTPHPSRPRRQTALCFDNRLFPSKM